jgi:hypothetical protein
VTVDWRRVGLTEHMSEAAAVVGECQVVLEFGPDARFAYEIKVYATLKGDAGEPYFALGRSAADPEGYRPFGSAATPEAAVDACLAAAGIHHRRHVKQSRE